MPTYHRRPAHVRHLRLQILPLPHVPGHSSVVVSDYDQLLYVTFRHTRRSTISKVDEEVVPRHQVVDRNHRLIFHGEHTVHGALTSSLDLWALDRSKRHLNRSLVLAVLKQKEVPSSGSASFRLRLLPRQYYLN